VKAFRKLVIFALLFIPVEAQPASSVSPKDANNSMREAVVNPDPGSTTPVPDVQDADMQFPVFRTLGGMGLVICLMAVAFFAAKKFAPRYFTKPASERDLKILETLAMGDKRSISLIEVAHTRYLIGNTPHQINLLAAFPETISVASGVEPVAAAPKKANRKGTGNLFRNLFEIEKGSPQQLAGHPLPEDLRLKMRQLRDSLERS